jgi:hypothetical protein
MLSLWLIEASSRRHINKERGRTALLHTFPFIFRRKFQNQKRETRMSSPIKSTFFIATPAVLIAIALNGFAAQAIFSSLTVSVAAFFVAMMVSQPLAKSAAPLWKYVVYTAITFALIANLVLWSFQLANPHLALVGLDSIALIGHLHTSFVIGAAAGFGAWLNNFNPYRGI